MAQVINFWLGKGIKGFRFDVIDMVSKDWGRLAMSNGPRLHDYIRELNAESFGGQEIITVGRPGERTLPICRTIRTPMAASSAWCSTSSIWGSAVTSGPPASTLAFKRAMARHQQGLHGRGWNSLFLGNHDLPRAVSRFGDDSPKWRETSAKLWAMVLQLMQGTPFIYQGRAGHDQPPLAAGRTARCGGDQLPRQPGGTGACRAESAARCHRPRQRPHPDAVGRRPHAGFSTTTPWIALNANHVEINAAEQLARPDSPFHCYRQLIALRKAYPVVRHGGFELLDGDDPERISYRRRWQDPASAERHTLLLLANLTEHP